MICLTPRWILLTVLGALLIAPSEGAFAFGSKPKRPDAAPAVLAAFQGSCGSQGVFTQAAQAQTSSIINVLQTLKATDACKPFAAQLGTIQTALGQIQALQQSNSYSVYQADQQNNQLLTLALQNSTPGSPEAQAFATALQQSQIQTYSDQAAYNVATKTSQRSLIVSQSSALLGWGQQLTVGSSSSSLAQCLLQSPAAALELGSNLAAFGGSFMPTVYGAGVNVVAQLLNTGLEVFRQGSYDSAIFDAQNVQMPDALSCALESMSESYCNATDSYKLLDLARRNRLANYAASPLWQGIDILSRQLPALLRWLDQIQNEVPPQDSYQANRQNAVLSEILQVQQTNLNITAAINVAISQSHLATTPAAKLSLIVSMIANQALYLSSPVYTSNGSAWIDRGSAFHARDFTPELLEGCFASCPGPGERRLRPRPGHQPGHDPRFRSRAFGRISTGSDEGAAEHFGVSRSDEERASAKPPIGRSPAA